MYIVYKTTNLIDGKYYIGVHNCSKSNYLGSGKYLKGAIKLYGKENFIRKTLREFDNSKDAYDFERLIVDLDMLENKNCYNLKIGGSGGNVGIGENHPMYGKRHTEESKKNMSDAQKGENNGFYGKHHSEKSKRKMSSTRKGENHNLYGKHHSEETRRKIGIANKGKTHSEETRRKIGDAQKGETHHMYGKTHSEETKQKMSDVRRSHTYYINDIIFHSSIEAGTFYGVNHQTILNWCKSPKHPNCYRELRNTNGTK